MKRKQATIGDRQHFLTLRCTEEEFKRISDKAWEARKTRSAWVRELLVKAITTSAA
jgi:hypothetical protein